MMNARASILTAAALLTIWIVLVFGASIPSGWIHVPLAAAVALIARAIVVGDDRTPH